MRLFVTIVCAFAALSSRLSAQELPRSVEREFEIRERALFPERFDWQVDTASDWRELHARLEALLRSAGELTRDQLVFVRACVEHEHSNVRAQALAVMALAGAGIEGVDAVQILDELQGDPMPEVREQLAGVLANVEGEDADRRLLELEGDSDSNVADAARVELLSRGESSLSTQIALFGASPLHLDAGEFIAALFVLDHLPPNRPLFDGVSESMAAAVRAEQVSWFDSDSEDAKAANGNYARWTSRRALWEALRHSRGIPYDGDAVAAGWNLPLYGADEWTERKRRKRLLEAAERGNGSLYEPLFQRLAPHVVAGAGTGDVGLSAAERSWLLEGAIQSYFSHSIVRKNRKDFPITPGMTPEFLVDFFEQVEGLADGWISNGLHAYYDVSPEVRSAAFSAFAETWSRTGEPRSRRLVVKALEYPDLALDAFRTLIGGRHAVPEESTVYRWWKSQPEEERMDLLDDFRRGVRFESWRETLLTAWSREATRSVSVAELLGGYIGDAEVEELLGLWINRELLILEASPAPAEDVKDGPWREAEARALWLTRSWLRIRTQRDGSSEPGPEVELLLRVGDLGKELGKLLVGRLVKFPAGRAATAEVLSNPALSRRVRFEILLTNEDITSVDSLREMFVAYDTCDADLRARIARRAAGVQDEIVLRRLQQIAQDSEAEPAERLAAIESMASAGSDEEVVPWLAEFLRGRFDFDLKQAAVASLGSRARSLDGLGLRELHADPVSRAHLGDALLPALVRIELRGSGVVSEETLEVWRAEAGSRAVEELEARFRSEELAARNFVYGGWLNAALALLESEQLEAALGEDYWKWDARLLARLGETILETNTIELVSLASKIDRAALIGLLGEGDAPERPALLVRLRARMLQRERWTGNWAAAQWWAEILLRDWRTGRSSPTAIGSVLGTFDRTREHDPRNWLLSIYVGTFAWQALEEGDLERAKALNARARALAGESATALSDVRRLERAMRQAED